MRLKVCYHDNCFDGLASAATFTRFFLEKIEPKAQVDFEGLAYKGGSPFHEGLFTGDVNAVLDFRYTQHPKLDWYFDHHVSAFQEPGDEAHFQADESGKKFWDPKAKSCTLFLARTLEEKFGFDAGPMKELIEWAEIIDGAQFPNAKMAVELEEPALRLMTWIEAQRDPTVLHRIIGWMQTKSLEWIVDQPGIREEIQELLARHRENVELIRERAVLDRGVVFYDIADVGRDNVNKFIPYYLHPSCSYCINVTASPSRAKISLGSNPWAPTPRTHDLAQLASRFGGGGHPVVAAASFPPDEIDEARAAAKEIAEILRG